MDMTKGHWAERWDGGCGGVAIQQQIVPPVSKILACGDVGNGAMATVEFLVQRTRQVVTDEAKRLTHCPASTAA